MVSVDPGGSPASSQQGAPQALRPRLTAGLPLAPRHWQILHVPLIGPTRDPLIPEIWPSFPQNLGDEPEPDLFSKTFPLSQVASVRACLASQSPNSPRSSATFVVTLLTSRYQQRWALPPMLLVATSLTNCFCYQLSSEDNSNEVPSPVTDREHPVPQSISRYTEHRNPFWFIFSQPSCFTPLNPAQAIYH